MLPAPLEFFNLSTMKERGQNQIGQREKDNALVDFVCRQAQEAILDPNLPDTYKDLVLEAALGTIQCMSSEQLGQRGQFTKVEFPGSENYTAGGCRFSNRLCCRVCFLIWSRFESTSLALPK